MDVVVRIEGFDEARVPVKAVARQNRQCEHDPDRESQDRGRSRRVDSSVVQIDELSRKFPRKAVDDFQKALESKRKGDIAKSQELLEGVVKNRPDFRRCAQSARNGVSGNGQVPRR